jgi:phosphoglycolate phosphatase-like HAD superfamily hydrolase
VLLFDLEGTLVDVDLISPLREARKWREYVADAGRSLLYPGVRELLIELRERRVRWAIVTNLPSMCADALQEEHLLHPDARVCFHDVPRGHHKPHPAMCMQALRALGERSANCIGVGDRDEDAEAFRASEVPGMCAGWNPHANRMARWSGLLEHPVDLVPRLEAPA